VGNYGVPSMDVMDKACGLPQYFESKSVQISGLVVSNYSEDPSHWASKESLGAWLARSGIPAISGVRETRAEIVSGRRRGHAAATT